MGFGLGFRVFPRLLRKDEAAFQGYSKEQFLGFRVCVCVFVGSFPTAGTAVLGFTVRGFRLVWRARVEGFRLATLLVGLGA